MTLVSAPIDSTNCFYANTWMAPRSGGRRHEGVDIIAKAGTPLYAAQRGRVVRSQGSLAGNQAKIVAADGTYFIYAHLSAYADDTAPHGATVEAGAVIGYVGKTGSTTVNHLHFEVHPNGGRAVDPTSVVAAVNTCGTKVAQKAVANPSPWAAVTTTTTPARTTVHQGADDDGRADDHHHPPPTTPATTVAPATTTIAPVTTTVARTTTAPGTTTLPPTTTAPATTAPATTAPAGGSGAKTFAKPVLVQQLKQPGGQPDGRDPGRRLPRHPEIGHVRHPHHRHEGQGRRAGRGVAVRPEGRV